VPPAQIAGLQLILGAAVLAPLADMSTAWRGWQSWSSLLILGLVHTGLMYNLMYGAFQRLTAGMIASLSFIYPLVAIVVDFAFFDTTLSPIQLFGILLILIAVVANQRAWDLLTFRTAFPKKPVPDSGEEAALIQPVSTREAWVRAQ
jgi:drug/metabolite transporter (DMT)-like permease